MKYIFHIITAALLISPFGITACYQHATRETVAITVKDKERIVTGSGETLSSKYLVFASNETFENSDAWFSLKFSSSDLQGKLERGRDYSVVVYGWRIPFLSMYRNIVSVNSLETIKN